ncbi:catechol 2,3-dioxygenase-like lactoylglutathione lyase family enzyme [Kitasatospora sp. MAA4]|uniref:VOC family protein n=1 Tax=Kitasatospora sp. MAA4 TaxID=3035093 RepID=UPI00247336AB|nr:VOC family protein [Kitasatospora sp. MAA4]MDH6135577.1 catechol 2,3-dioxygenase-like lactoylglutathione lyase family enzyme [Kitasatospora sp. MAA4]
MTPRTGPLVGAVHHVAYTVPDLEQAITFFTEALGAELAYRAGPISDPDGDWTTRHLGVHPRAVVRLAMLRLGPAVNLELFEYAVPDQRRALPLNSDWGGHHLALWTEDIDAAVAQLAARPGVRVLGGIDTVTDGPIAGARWVYLTTPWGMQLELVHFPDELPFQETTAVRLFDPRRLNQQQGVRR